MDLLEDRAEVRQITDNLLGLEAETVPHRLELAPNRDIEASMQRAIERPVLHIQPRVCFLQLSNTYLHTFQNSVLDFSHLIAHRDFQLNDLGFSVALKRLRNSDVKAWP